MTKLLIEQFINHIFKISDVLKYPAIKKIEMEKFDQFCKDNNIGKGHSDFNELFDVYFAAGEYYCMMNDKFDNHEFIKTKAVIVNAYISKFGLTIETLYQTFKEKNT